MSDWRASVKRVLSRSRVRHEVLYDKATGRPASKLIEQLRCPGCKIELGGACPVGGSESDAAEGPPEGALGTCGHCGAIIEFHCNSLRLVPDEVWNKLSDQDRRELSEQAKDVRPTPREGLDEELENL